MINKAEFQFENVPPTYKRFFSTGNLNSLKEHLRDNYVDFGRLWVRAFNSPIEEFLASIRFAFIREEQAKSEGEQFSEKVVITGIVSSERIKMTGGMNDEVEYIEGLVELDRIFLITGVYDKPEIEDITEQLISSG